MTANRQAMAQRAAQAAGAAQQQRMGQSPRTVTVLIDGQAMRVTLDTAMIPHAEGSERRIATSGEARK